MLRPHQASLLMSAHPGYKFLSDYIPPHFNDQPSEALLDVVWGMALDAQAGSAQSKSIRVGGASGLRA